MNITITMPQLGLTMTEGTVSAWLKKLGDTIKKDEAVLVVSTDKIDMDIESTADGVLNQIIVEQGQTVAVGTALCYIDVPGNESPDPNAAETSNPLSVTEGPKDKLVGNSSSPDSEPRPIRAELDVHNERLRISPRARRRAMQLGIDIETFKGSGPNGRVVEEDLLKLVAKPSHRTSPDANSQRRRLIADRMMESVTTIPPFSVSLEVNAETLVALYENLREPVGRVAGTKLSYTDLLLKALALSLTRTPAMNSVWQGGALHQQSTIDVAFAVATDRGVVAPVVTNVDGLTLQQLVSRRAELVEKSRQSRLTVTDLEGGVGMLSNLGMYRVDRFQGIISPGQTFILAVGKLRNRPWVDTSLVIKPTIIFNLSVDHRVADGAIAAVFLERIAEVIENPYQILWNAEA